MAFQVQPEHLKHTQDCWWPVQQGKEMSVVPGHDPHCAACLYYKRCNERDAIVKMLDGAPLYVIDKPETEFEWRLLRNEIKDAGCGYRSYPTEDGAKIFTEYQVGEVVEDYDLILEVGMTIPEGRRMSTSEAWRERLRACVEDPHTPLDDVERWGFYLKPAEVVRITREMGYRVADRDPDWRGGGRWTFLDLPEEGSWELEMWARRVKRFRLGRKDEPFDIFTPAKAA